MIVNNNQNCLLTGKMVYNSLTLTISFIYLRHRNEFLRKNEELMLIENIKSAHFFSPPFTQIILNKIKSASFPLFKSEKNRILKPC